MTAHKARLFSIVLAAWCAQTFAACAEDPMDQKDAGDKEQKPELQIKNVRYRYYEGSTLSVSGTAAEVGYSTTSGAVFSRELKAVFHKHPEEQVLQTEERPENIPEDSIELNAADAFPAGPNAPGEDGTSQLTQNSDDFYSDLDGDAVVRTLQTASDSIDEAPDDGVDEEKNVDSEEQTGTVVLSGGSISHFPEGIEGPSEGALEEGTYADDRQISGDVNSENSASESGGKRRMAALSQDIIAEAANVSGNIALKWIDATDGVRMRDINGTLAVTESASIDAKTQRIFSETPVVVTGRGLVATAESGFLISLQGDRVLHFQGPIQSRIFATDKKADGGGTEKMKPDLPPIRSRKIAPPAAAGGHFSTSTGKGTGASKNMPLKDDPRSAVGKDEKNASRAKP